MHPAYPEQVFLAEESTHSCNSSHLLQAASSGHPLQPGPSTCLGQNPQQTRASNLRKRRQNEEQTKQIVEKRQKISKARQIPPLEQSSVQLQPESQLEQGEFKIIHLFICKQPISLFQLFRAGEFTLSL